MAGAGVQVVVRAFIDLAGPEKVSSDRDSGYDGREGMLPMHQLHTDDPLQW